MRPSIRQAGRICDACKQQRHLATRSFTHASSTPSRTPRVLANPSTAVYRRSPSCIPHTRPFSNSRSCQSEVEVEAEAEAESATSSPSPAQGEKKKQQSPAVPQTHYEFFPKTLPDGPPPSGPFAIDVRALRREFLQLQGSAHPDRHPQHMKGRAEATSARINEAFKTLESPLLRAQYVLSLRGIDVANDETAKVEDPELLMLVLETRETIEEAREEADLEGLRVANEERVRESEGRLEEAFRTDDIETARTEVVRLRYWINIRDSINNWEKGKPVVLEH